MKKSNVVLLILVMTAIACQKNPFSKKSQEDNVFTANFETPQSKTMLSSRNVLWSAGDQIAVFANGAKECYTLIDGENSTNGTFSGKQLTADEYYAIYPYSEAAVISSSIITAEIPQCQTPTLNGFGPGQNVAVAYSTDRTLALKNVCTLLKFEILSANVGQIIITGNNGEDLSGKVQINMESGQPVCTCVEGKKSVVLQSADKPLSPGCYYAAVLPQTFSKGITITLKPYVWQTGTVVLQSYVPDDIVRTSSNSLEAPRSHIVPLGCLDEKAVWNYSKVKVNCLRDTAKDCGQYFDFNTGRSFFALGAYDYCQAIDLAFIQWTGAGFASIYTASAISITNSTNLGKYGTADMDRDPVSCWAVKNVTQLCYLPSMTETEYNTISTQAQIQAIFDGCTTVKQYFSNMDTDGNNLTNARIQDGSQKFCVFKTGNSEEGAVIGIMKFNNVNGTSGQWAVDFDYKCAAVPGPPGPDPEPVQPVGSKKLVNPCGLCTNPCAGAEKQYGEQIFKNVTALGVRWIRSDFIWGWCNPSVGSWNYSYMDNTVAYAKTYGINILPILAYDTEWARPVVDHLDDWLDYVTRIVTRYKDYIRCWEVYNEPNHKDYWHGEDPNADRYAVLLKATYECIKNIDPSLTVISGGLAGAGLTYMEQCLKAGTGPYFDAMNFHPYHIDDSPERVIPDIEKAYALLAKYGCEDKPLWITEVGWVTPTPAGEHGITEYTQAAYLARVFLISFAKGVGKTFWFQYRSPEGTLDNFREHYGIVHKDLTPKISNSAMAALLANMPSNSTRPEMTVVGDKYTCHWKNPDGKDVWAFWNKGGTVEVNLTFTGEIESACDVLGNSLTLSPGPLQVGDGCIYVTGPTALSIN